jgi:hypothetical protein
MRTVHIIILIITLLCYRSSALVINMVSLNGSTNPANASLLPIHLASAYSTIGTRPTYNISSPLVFLSADNLESCSLRQTVNVSGSVVVFLGALPPFYACNRHIFGITTVLTKILQSNNATGVIISAMEGVKDEECGVFVSDFHTVAHSSTRKEEWWASLQGSTSLWWLQHQL